MGLITTDSFGRFSIPVMLGAEDALGTGQVSVFMCDTRDDAERERRYVEMLWARRVDGLIVTGRRIEPRPPVQVAARHPGRVRDDPARRRRAPTSAGGGAVLPDDEGGGRAAAAHLLAIGRRRIAHIAGPERFLAARLRARGFTAALAEAGATPCGEIRFGEWSEHWGREAAGLLLADRPDAIFCGSDQIARGVADTLRAVGRRIPDDVALVGFDNWLPMAMGALPPLTSVDPCLEEVGRVAATRLLAAIGGEHADDVHRVPARLDIRESTGGYAPAGPSGPRPYPPAAPRGVRPAAAGLTAIMRDSGRGKRPLSSERALAGCRRHSGCSGAYVSKGLSASGSLARGAHGASCCYLGRFGWAAREAPLAVIVPECAR